MGFLWKVMVKAARRQWDGTWRRAAAGDILKEAGNQKLGTYIDKATNDSGGLGDVETYI